MNRPALPGRYADRFLDCQCALEDHFIEMMEAASEAGWAPAETAAAIVDLADNYMLQIFANDDTRRQLAAAIKRGAS